MNKDMIKTWLLAIFSIFILWGLGNNFLGVSAKVFNANAIIYTCSIFIGSSFSLLIYSGYGEIKKSVFKHFDIWFYCIIYIVSFIISFYLFSIITAAESSFLQRSSIISISFISWIVFKKELNYYMFIAVFLISLGLYSIYTNLPHETKAIVLILVIILSILQSLRTILAEYYRPYKFLSEETKSKDKSRNIGAVMLIVSVCCLFLFFIFSLIEYFTQTNVSPIIPNIKEFTNPYSIFMGFLVGICIIAPIRIIEFTVTNKIKSETYLALGILAPFSTLFWEWATSPITHLSLKEFSSSDLLAGIIILIGGLIIAFSKAKKQIVDDVNEYVYQTYTDIESVEDSKDILQKSLTYCNNDLLKLSKILKLPEDALKVVLEKNDIALKKDTLKRIERVYRLEISSKDSLTGILNRSGLMQNLEKLIDKNKDFTLFYIDLNKFKPINDTYGHQAGDEALQTMANRLALFNKHAKIVSRIGGDEFVVILEKNLDINEFTKNMHTVIEDFFVLPSVNMVAGMSASIGHVKSVDYKGCKAEDLLKIADKMMLSLKENSQR